MKLLTQEEVDAHYSAVLRAGAIGGVVGLGLGVTGVWAAGKRFPRFGQTGLPYRAFLVSSATMGVSVTFAERASLNFARARDPMNLYKDESQRILAEARAVETTAQRSLEWAREHRYTIVMSSWATAVVVALAIVSRNRFLTTSQKVVQARVYAQGLTVAILLATAALEVGEAKAARKGGWDTVEVADPSDPEHKRLVKKRVHREEYEGQDLWKDMVAAEERRLRVQKEEELTQAAQASQA